MEGIGRKADGRRIFSVEFKRQAVGRVHSGEKTLAELSRELEVQPSVLRNWMRLVDRGGTAAVAAGEDVVPASRVRELERVDNVVEVQLAHPYGVRAIAAAQVKADRTTPMRNSSPIHYVIAGR